MKRRHFIAIAKILREYHKSVEMGWSYDIAEAFADLCEAENPQFNREKFLTACIFEI